MDAGKLLQKLRQEKDYVSGQALCETYHVSRTAVWKAMKKLTKNGYQISAVRNRGYKLVREPLLLSRERLLQEENIPWKGAELEFYEETDSTNNRAIALAEKRAPEGTLVVAEKQTAGKGRRGRSWSTPAGVGLAFSYLLYPPLSPESASMLTLVKAYSLSRALDAFLPDKTTIKWPNDVLLHNKKVAGILTEAALEGNELRYVVIGSGINVNTPFFPEDLADKATSLFLETGQTFDRAAVLGAIARAFEADYRAVLSAGSLTPILRDYNEKLVNRDAEVRVLDPKGSFDGVAGEVTEKGELLVQTEHGGTVRVYAGEVSVRGIGGYV